MKKTNRPEKNIAERVRAFAQPEVEALGFELWDITFEKVGTVYQLVIYIDSPNGIKIEDCEAVSRAVDPLLDRYDPIEQSYTFSVSSAGLERALTKPAHFERFMGSLVSVSLYKAFEGSKRLEGRLVSRSDESTDLEIEGKTVTLANSDISSVRLVYTGGF